jgi:hypothetical protein
MKFALAALGLVASLAGPALAADMADVSKMTCGEFAAMDSEGMMKATTAIKEAAMADTMADKAKTEMGEEDLMKAITASCDGKPDMMAMDAMHAGM